MKYEEALKLIDAGFTADEVRKMAEEGTPDPEGKPEPGTDEGKPEGAPSVDPSPEVKALTAEVGKLTDAVKAMQEEAIKKASTGSAKGGPDPVQEQINAFIKEL